MIENGQPDRGKSHGSKASSNERLHGNAPHSDIAFDYIANSQIAKKGVRGRFMESLIIRC
jgi:hypothetical protein